ncbi:DUF397 domain-containing protein [Streptomyces sp. DSM 44915]|uniref:DUF397 domain-containing protein n=1 Tax=Streptomyces chisholmiae TaxID=3075540 RepID=A0ABU2JNG2_9ACTN|nr:DUF397 domain-containing protein [Streptomyces sp. DSM 44915]MDT0266437.1 DUF397 domain-containing protein [Streptomyces sp. DSM 44915]
MADHGADTLRWRKSSYSGASGGDCLEVALGRGGLVPLRDSKRAGGPVVAVSMAAWRAFVGAVDGERRVAR